jgi:pimeloyl-ACP methyl ester carboxylesterase
MSSDSLPLDARYVRSPKKAYAETVVFVHHYGGNRASVKRHQDFVSDLGFDSVAFTMTQPYGLSWLKSTPLSEIRLALRERWEHDITNVLNSVRGQKIVYSFSFPSAPAVGSIGLRGARDVSAWICDGGPFLMPVRCMWNYYTHIEPVRALWLRSARVALGVTAMGMWRMEEYVHAALKKLPNDFPVLSIRSWKDPLVPIAAIDEAFAVPHMLRLESLTLPEAGHINGLQQFPEDYKPRVAQFLNRYATRMGAAEATT